MSVARATFIEYLDGIGMGLEIRAYPKNSKVLPKLRLYSSSPYA